MRCRPPPPMPQFETERRAASGAASGGADAATVRALDAADAVRRAFGLAPHAVVAVGEASPRDGWAAVTVDGAPAGRVRPHARMRFRRD